MKGLKIKVLVSLLLLALFQSTAATTFKVIYLDDPGEGAFDETPVAPWFNNPGTTLGEQRRNAHEYAISLIERAVWIDNRVPLVSNVYFENFDEGVLAYDLTSVGRLHDSYKITDLQFAVLNPDMARIAEEPLSMQIAYNADEEFDYFLGPQLIFGGTKSSLVTTALHEFGHALGFRSSVSSYPSSYYTPTLFDRYVRLAGANPTRPEDMTPEQRAMLHRAGENVRWVGTATSEAAGRILTAGQDQGEVFLDGYSRYISHLSVYVRPVQLMGHITPSLPASVLLLICSRIWAGVRS